MYAPALTAILSAAALVLARAPIAEIASRFGLGMHAGVTLAAILAAGIVVLAAALCDRPPARWFVAGALAVSLGANLASGPWIVAPLIALGVVAILAREAQRLFAGLTLGTEALTLHRPLKEPLTVAYTDIEAIHTAPTREGAGTLILETVHGTVTAQDLPEAADLQARIEARTASFDLSDPHAAATQARKKIQTIVRGERPA